MHVGKLHYNLKCAIMKQPPFSDISGFCFKLYAYLCSIQDGYTALHIAVQYCKPMAVQTLLGFGAMVELKGGKAKETPLHIAARTPDGEKCAEMLLKSGADVNAAQEVSTINVYWL